MRFFILSMMGCGALFGQAPAKLEFEVATIKPSNIQSPANGGVPVFFPEGGPGTTDPGQFNYRGAWLRGLLMMAFGVKDNQMETPGWVGDQRFDISAKVPPGTTPEQFNAMLQNLLLERFRIWLHHESKLLTVLALTVAKNGPKFRESPKLTESKLQPATGVKPDERGFPTFPPSFSGVVRGGWMGTCCSRGSEPRSARCWCGCRGQQRSEAFVFPFRLRLITEHPVTSMEHQT